VLLKRRRDVPADFFAAEARGLAALRDASGLRTPTVLGVCEGGIALEDLGQGRAGPSDWASAGRALARQHAHTSKCFGFAHSGYIGDSPQDNRQETDGHRFFAEQRLWPQAQRAAATGLLDRGSLRQLERLCAHLRERLPRAAPALLHGDLWLGNMHACASGELALIDAGATHYGWPAADLAMLTLFGSPPAGFFTAYESEGGLRDWREHSDLLNLYHLLNHLNLFGREYLAAVTRALRRVA
jgi:fructosamine-3-kinase